MLRENPSDMVLSYYIIRNGYDLPPNMLEYDCDKMNAEPVIRKCKTVID